MTEARQIPAILSRGFRPFFLLASLYAGLAVLLWLPVFADRLALASLFTNVDWHAHEMVFGFAPAVITGFLLTAIPNWTGRLPVRGWPLLSLVLIWLAGRLAVTFSASLGWLPTLLIDCSFLLALALVALREIVAGSNWRNLKVLLPVTMLLAANILFHLEAHFAGAADFGRRFGLSAVLVLIMLIGGRIIPSFTRNWLARRTPDPQVTGRLPSPFGRFDMATIGFSVVFLLGWTFAPELAVTGYGLIICAGLHLVRLGRWAGYRTFANRLVLVLHCGYLFVAVGLFLNGLAIVLPDLVPPSAGIHALGVGAIGTMTLAVMARATLGHTGRAMWAGVGTQMIFAAVIFSAVVRIVVALGVLDGMAIAPHLLSCAGYAWSGAFLGFALLYGKALVGPRRNA